MFGVRTEERENRGHSPPGKFGGGGWTRSFYIKGRGVESRVTKGVKRSKGMLFLRPLESPNNFPLIYNYTHTTSTSLFSLYITFNGSLPRRTMDQRFH